MLVCLCKLVNINVVWMSSPPSLIPWAFVYCTHGNKDALNWTEWMSCHLHRIILRQANTVIILYTRKTTTTTTTKLFLNLLCPSRIYKSSPNTSTTWQIPKQAERIHSDTRARANRSIIYLSVTNPLERERERERGRERERERKGSSSSSSSSSSRTDMVCWCSSVGRASDRYAADAGLILRCGKDFSPRVNDQCRLSYSVRIHPRAIAYMKICVHVKDPAVHGTVWWIMETLKHQACVVGWVARLCGSWLTGKATRTSHARISKWDNTVVKRVSKSGK